jgi:hypothetical protein
MAARAVAMHGATACFGHTTDFGVTKSVRFENKKITVLDLKFVFFKS